MTKKKQNTVNLKDCLTIQQLTSLPQLSHMKTPDLISFLVSKGCKKLVLDAPFQGKIVFLKSEIKNLLDELS